MAALMFLEVLGWTVLWIHQPKLRRTNVIDYLDEPAGDPFCGSTPEADILRNAE